MAIDNQKPNSKADIESATRSIDAIMDSLQTPGSIQEVLNIATTALGKEGVKIRPMLQEMVNNVDRPILKDMAQEVVTVMSNWFEDPRTLCCLVQGLFTFFEASTTRTTLENTDFAKWLDILIAFVDLIIVFLTSELKKIAFAIPDFITEIVNGVIGAILLVLQEVLFAIRDSVINILIEEFSYRTRHFEMFTKCLPLSELIEIFRKYISDFGLFAELFEKIKGYVGSIVGDFGYMKALDFPKNIKDIEFLYWFRDLLVKLKTAALSFDLCFLPQSNGLGEPGSVTPAVGVETSINPNLPTELGLRKTPVNASIQGISITADGTILQDKATATGSSLPILTNSSVRAFLNKYYGHPLDVVDSILVGPTSADSVQGTNVESAGGNLYNADCPNSPDPYEAIRWALRVRNRNL